MEIQVRKVCPTCQGKAQVQTEWWRSFEARKQEYQRIHQVDDWRLEEIAAGWLQQANFSGFNDPHLPPEIQPCHTCCQGYVFEWVDAGVLVAEQIGYAA